MSPLIWWLIFLASAVAVFFSSRGLVRAGDALATRTGISHTFIGVLLLATATSLPELATGASAVTVANSPDLAAGDIFGSNVFNLAIIGLMELFVPRQVMLGMVHPVVRTPTLLSGLLIAAATFAIVASRTVDLPVWAFRLATPVLLAGYVGSLYWMARKEQLALQEEDLGENPELPGTRRALGLYAVSAAGVVLGGTGLAYGGEGIATSMGWASSFVGTFFVAASTSLPEISTSLAALRLGAHDLAVSNMVGSNLFNTGVVTFTDDLFYAGGAFLVDISIGHVATLGIAMAMTAVVAIGINSESQGKLAGRLTVGAILLFAMFLAANALAFLVGE